MNRQQFLRMLVATPLLTGFGFLFGSPAPAHAQGNGKQAAQPNYLEELRQADRGVDLAYDKCATGRWALPYQRDYLQAALKAARAYERYEPDNAYGQSYYVLAVDIATDVQWDPRKARQDEVLLLKRAAEYTLKRRLGDQHVARATALLKKIRSKT